MVTQTNKTAGVSFITDFHKIWKQEMRRLKCEKPEIHATLKQEIMLRKYRVCPIKRQMEDMDNEPTEE